MLGFKVRLPFIGVFADRFALAAILLIDFFGAASATNEFILHFNNVGDCECFIWSSGMLQPNSHIEFKFDDFFRRCLFSLRR